MAIPLAAISCTTGERSPVSSRIKAVCSRGTRVTKQAYDGREEEGDEEDEDDDESRPCVRQSSQKHAACLSRPFSDWRGALRIWSRTSPPTCSRRDLIAPSPAADEEAEDEEDFDDADDDDAVVAAAAVDVTEGPV